jgi:hypothetical protein
VTTSNPGSKKQRRRVAVAHLIQRRVRGQRERFATEYGKAQTAHERFYVVTNALRAATAKGRHLQDPDNADRLLDQLTDAMVHVLAELHDTQYSKAAKTLRADQQRIERNERRLDCDGRTPLHST